ncbi:hypothetical protein FNH22_13260 [Fulvivirga sp. M361]|uniref:hypothetical protein n=1 Tax=Fulvivirga sp. M361 TaxID=2594266 RepID=UPI00117BA9C9|nr:hypothetical protein [Fulvivirga sp. M361]TRX58837.1 hypothetical protein FNH22_13260 [Fulvivirga sp. M361]
MKIFNFITICTLLLLIACNSEQSKEIDPKLSNALIEEYKEATKQDNIDGLMNLVYWENVQDDVKEMMVNTSNAVLKHEFLSAEVVPMPEDFETTYIRNGNKYGFKIEPFAKLIVQFNPEAEVHHMKKKEYFVTELNGKYILTTVALLEENVE